MQLARPLTEYIHMMLLTVPLLVLYVFLSRQGIKTAPNERLAVALILIWVPLCPPLFKVEPAFANHMSLDSSLTDLYLAAPYLYAMFAMWAMLVVTGNLIGVRSLSARDLFEAI